MLDIAPEHYSFRILTKKKQFSREVEENKNKNSESVENTQQNSIHRKPRLSFSNDISKQMKEQLNCETE